MNSAPARTFVSFVVPGGALLIAALVLAHVPAAHATAQYVVNFLLWTAMLGALAMAWRFNSSRVVFAAVVLCLADRALVMLGHAGCEQVCCSFRSSARHRTACRATYCGVARSGPPRASGGPAVCQPAVGLAVAPGPRG